MATAAPARAAPAAIRVICQPGMPPPVTKVTPVAAPLVQQSGGGSGPAKAAGAVARASTVPASVATAAKMRRRCFMVLLGGRWVKVRARIGTAAQEGWNYLGIFLEGRLGIVVQWGEPLARAAGWEPPGRVGAMAADTVADQTELADFGILGPLEVSRCGC